MFETVFFVSCKNHPHTGFDAQHAILGTRCLRFANFKLSMYTIHVSAQFLEKSANWEQSKCNNEKTLQRF